MKQSGKENILFFLKFCIIFIYLFFSGIVTALYIKFTFDGLQYKLWSINYGALKFIHYGAGKRKAA